MDLTSEIDSLERRLSEVVKSRCNTVGCDNCDLKFGGFDSDECSATDLQGRIMDLEIEAFAPPQTERRES